MSRGLFPGTELIDVPLLRDPRRADPAPEARRQPRQRRVVRLGIAERTVLLTRR